MVKYLAAFGVLGLVAAAAKAAAMPANKPQETGAELADFHAHMNESMNAIPATAAASPSRLVTRGADYHAPLGRN